MGRAWAKYGRAVVGQLGHALSDVLEGPVSGGLLGGSRERIRVPAPAQLLDGGDIDRAVVEVVLDGRQVGGQELPVGADRVSAQGRSAGLGHVGADEVEGPGSGLLEAHRRRL